MKLYQYQTVVLVLLCLIYSVSAADRSTFELDFEDTACLTVGHDNDVASAQVRQEFLIKKHGQAAVAMEWENKPGRSGTAWFEIEIEPTNMEGRKLSFWVRPTSGKWEGSDRTGGSGHGHLGIWAWDSDGQLVCKHDWVTWYHVARPGIWGREGKSPLIIELGVQPRRPYLGKLEKGTGNIKKITKLRFYAQATSGSKCGIIWDHLTDKEAVFHREVREYEKLRPIMGIGYNWDLPVVSAGKPQPRPFGKIILTDGDKNFAKVKMTEIKRGKHSWVENELNGNLVARHEILSMGNGLVHKVTVQNKGTSWRNIAVNCSVPVKKGRDTRFWDGVDFYDNICRPFERVYEGTPFGMKSYNYQAPLAAVIDENKVVMLGMGAYDYVSYQNVSVKPVADNFILTYGTRLAIKGGAESTIHFVYGQTGPAYGVMEAVALYQKMYPEVFRPIDNLDPRYWLGELGNKGYFDYRNFKLKDNTALALEIGRRSSMGWQWVFGGYKRLGDFYGRPQWWSGYPTEDEIIAAYKDRKGHKGYSFSCEDFHKWRKEIWIPYVTSWGGAVSFHLINYCEKQLLDTEFAGSEMVAIPYYHGLGAAAGYSGLNSYRTFMWYTPFGRHLVRDMQALREEIGIKAMAMDILGTNGGLKFRGTEAIENAPWVAFDKKGPYVDEAIGFAMLATNLRNLPPDKDGHGFAMQHDSPNHWQTAFTNDLWLTETGSNTGPMMMLYLKGRILHGHKPIVMHRVHWHPNTVFEDLPINSMQPIEIREAYRKNHHLTLLSAIHFGIPLTFDDIIGYPEALRICVPITKLAKLGWEPISAVRTENKKMWTSRFGNGVGAVVTLANPTDLSQQSKCRIDNPYLGNMAYVPCDYFGDPTHCEINSDSTMFSVSTNRWRGKLFRIIAGFEKLNTSIKVIGSVVDTEKGKNIELNCDFAQAQKQCNAYSIDIYIPEEHHAKQLYVNGKEAEFKIKDQMIIAELPPQENINVRLCCESDYFRESKSKLLEFPFLQGDTPATIILPENADESDKLSARRIQAYFKIWYNEVAKPGRHITLPIVINQKAAKGSCPIIQIIESDQIDSSGIYLGHSDNRDIMYISGVGSGYREKATLSLLFLLDKKYPFVGQIVNGRISDKYQKILKRAGLWNVPLFDE